MKPALVVTLSFLLFAFTFPSKLASAVEQILDTNENPLTPDGQYYILPFVWGPLGGGFYPGKTGNSICPVTVRQYPSLLIDVNTDGVPVKFEISGAITGNIFSRTPLQISFAKKPNCAASAKWVLVTDKSGKSWVGIGDQEDHPDHKVVSGDFKIIKIWWWYYKLVFCPKYKDAFGASRSNGEACFNIKRQSRDEGAGVLGLTDNDDLALPVVFVKADTSPATSII